MGSRPVVGSSKMTNSGRGQRAGDGDALSQTVADGRGVLVGLVVHVDQLELRACRRAASCPETPKCLRMGSITFSSRVIESNSVNSEIPSRTYADRIEAALVEPGDVLPSRMTRPESWAE
jgi:hypothetical protein